MGALRMSESKKQSVFHKALSDAGLDMIDRVANIPDLGMRRALLAEEFSVLGDVAALWALDILIAEVLRGETRAQQVYDGIYHPEVVDSIFDNNRVGVLRELAVEERAYGAYHWLSCANQRTLSGNTLQSSARGRQPLGIRRAEARRAQGKTLEKLLHDPDPKVISNLLRSAQITEAFVLKLCSKRPVDGEILVIVTYNRKWFSRYSVKRALILNPDFPIDYAHNLMVYLSPKDLHLFSKEPTVSASLRASAGRLVGVGGVLSTT